MAEVKTIRMKDIKCDVHFSTVENYPVYNAIVEAEGVIGLGFGKDGAEAIVDALKNFRDKMQKLEVTG